MPNDYSTVSHWHGGFDESALQKWAERLRSQLAAPRVSLGLIFMTPRFFPHAAQVLEILRVHAQIPLLIGCSSTGLITGAEEVEEDGGLAVGLFHLPGAELRGHRFGQEQVQDANNAGFWPAETGVAADQVNGWLVFADPFHLDCDAWLKTWNEAYSPVPILGGLASSHASEQRTQIYVNGDVFEEGGVAIAFGGEVALAGVISQGCTPIGETWTITRVERNLIHEIGNRPAYEVLLDTFNALSSDDQKKTRGNLFVGLVINEYLEEFRRGDFLIRNLLGADPNSGCIAVGAFPRTGQTVQFQRRDAAAAEEDLCALLESARKRVDKKTLYGGCLCCCNGRGARLFGRASHDASAIQEQLGPFGLAGFFCNGEIGPVGNRSFLHGYTASLALFLKK